MGTANRKASGKIAATNAAAKKCGVNPISVRWLTPGAMVYISSEPLSAKVGVLDATVVEYPNATRTTAGKYILTVKVRYKTRSAFDGETTTTTRYLPVREVFKDEPSAASAIAARLRKRAAEFVSQAAALEEFAETYIPAPEDR